MQAPLDVSSGSSRRFVPEDDLKSERERWLQNCMHEVWNMENAAFERINEQIEQASLRLQSEVSAAVLKQVEAERQDRGAAVAELRKDLNAAHSSLEMQVQGVRRDLAAAQLQQPRPSEARPSDTQAHLQAAQFQAGMSAVQAQLEQQRLQLLTLEAALADVRSEMGLQREQQELQASSAVADLRQELSAVQMAHMQALQDQAARSSADIGRGLREIQGMLEASQGPLKAELKQDVEKLRSDVELERRQLDELATQVGKLEGAGNGVHAQLEELGRRLVEIQQDQLSETTILRSRVEAAVGDRAESQSQADTLQLLIKEEQGRRSVDVAALQARVDAVERLCAAAPAAASPSPEGRLPAGALEGLRAELAVLRARLERAEALDTGPKLAADLQLLTKRMEKTEALAGGSSVASSSHASSEVGALRAGLEALRGETARLAQDLTDERRDRCRALSDVNRIAEDIAKAAAATIERAERRFVAEYPPEQWDAHSNDSRRTRSGAEESMVSKLAEVSHTPSTSEEVRSAFGASMAKLVGEMDAELRVELTSRIRLVTAELRGEILSDVAVRIAAVEARAGIIEAGVGSEIQRIDRDVNSRLTALESVQVAPRLVALEEETKCNSRTLVLMLDERKKKAAEHAFDEIEAKCHHALAVGKAPSSSGGMDGSISVASQSSAKLHSPISEALAYAGEGQNFADCLKQSFEEGMKKGIDNIMSASTRSPSRPESLNKGPTASRNLSNTARSFNGKHSSRSPDSLRVHDGRLTQRPSMEAAARQRLDEATATSLSEVQESRSKERLDDGSASVQRRISLQHSVAREASSADPVAPLRANASSAAHATGAASADPVQVSLRGAAEHAGSPSAGARGRQAQPAAAALSPSLQAARQAPGSAWPAPQPGLRGGPCSVTPATTSAVRPQPARGGTQATPGSWAVFRGRTGAR